MSPDGQKLYAGTQNFVSNNFLYKIDTTSNTIQKTLMFDVPFFSSNGFLGIAVTPDASQIYVRLWLFSSHVERCVIVSKDFLSQQVIDLPEIYGFGCFSRQSRELPGKNACRRLIGFIKLP